MLTLRSFPRQHKPNRFGGRRAVTKWCRARYGATLRGSSNGHRPADSVERLTAVGTEVALVEPRLAGLHDEQSIIAQDADHGPPVVGPHPERSASALLLVE